MDSTTSAPAPKPLRDGGSLPLRKHLSGCATCLSSQPGNIAPGQPVQREAWLAQSSGGHCRVRAAGGHRCCWLHFSFLIQPARSCGCVEGQQHSLQLTPVPTPAAHWATLSPPGGCIPGSSSGSFHGSSGPALRHLLPTWQPFPETSPGHTVRQHFPCTVTASVGALACAQWGAVLALSQGLLENV